MASIIELPSGLHLDVPAEDYHARIPGLASKGVLDLFDRSPAHYWAWLQGLVRPDTAALKFGKALHCSMLEPYAFATLYTVAPDFGDCRKTDNKKRRDDWRTENGGRIWLDAGDMKAIEGMTAAVQAHPLARKMLEGGVSESTLRWVDEETGLICKARGDYYREDIAACFDVKTTEDARAAAVARSVAKYGYHRQHAHYDDGFAAVGAPLQHFVFVFVEKVAPYAVALFRLDDDATERGRESVRGSLRKMAACVESGEYPGYETSIQTLELPAWA